MTPGLGANKQIVMRALHICLSGSLLGAIPSKGEQDSETWHGKGDVGLTLATGNAESFRATAGLEVSRDLGNWEARGRASFLYGQDDGASSSERLESSFQLNHRQGNRLYTGITGEFLHDPLAGIDWRVGVTPLLGWRAVEAERLKLHLEIGPGYTWEDRDGGVRGFSSARLHERLSFQVAEGVQVFQSLTALLEAENFDNYTLTAEAGIESKLGGKWSLRVVGKAVYYGESQALEDEDLLLTAGFGYNHQAADYSEGSLESGIKGVTPDEGRWAVTALLGGGASRGNSESSSLSSGLKVKKEWQGGEFVAGTFGSYGEKQGITSAESLTADVHYQRGLRNQRFWGMRVDWDHDAVAGLEWRTALAPYWGCSVIETTRGKLSLEGGPSYVAEQQGGEENAFLAAYLAVKGECQLGSRTRIAAECSFSSDATEWKSCLFTSEVRLSHALSERLSLQVIGRSSYDTTPAAGRERHDLQLVSALGVKF